MPENNVAKYDSAGYILYSLMRDASDYNRKMAEFINTLTGNTNAITHTA